MQTEAQGECMAFLMGKALDFFCNYLKQIKGEIRDADFFMIIEDNLEKKEVMEIIEHMIPPPSEELKVPEPCNERAKDIIVRKLPISGTIGTFWDDETSRGGIREAILEMVERIRERTNGGSGGRDVFAERFQELGRLFGLSELEQDALLVAHLLGEKVLEPASNHRRMDPRRNIQKLLPWLSTQPHVLREILSPRGKLMKFRLLDEDLDFNEGLNSFLYGQSDAPLEHKFYARLKGEALPWGYFGNLAEKHGETLKALIRNRKPDRAFHVLLYGVPGSGKSSFAQSLAAELGLNGYGISQDIQNDNTARTCSTPEFRFGALRLCDERVDREKSLLVVDEADDMLRRTSGGGGLLAMLGGGSTAVGDKGLLNNLLDEVKTPCLWISNTSAGELDPSSRRRFDYSIRFDKLTAAQRRGIWKNNVEKYSLGGLFSEGLQELLAEKYEVSAGGISLVLKNLADVKPEAAECEKWVEKLMAPHCELLGIQTDKSKSRPAADYSMEGLNIQGDIPLERIVEAVRRFQHESKDGGRGGIDCPRMNLLLSGAPGTGKTEFVKHLGSVLKTRVVTKMGGDLLNMYVGGTEQNIKRAFEEAEADQSILFLDEIDGLLQNREQAMRSWEVTQVNELLHRMENFNGVMIGATNYTANLDPAVARRFTFKLEFGFLDEAGKVLFFERMFQAKLSPKGKKRLAEIPDLAPGDYRTVRQGLHYLGADLTNEERLAALDRESQAKGKTRYATKKIGF